MSVTRRHFGQTLAAALMLPASSARAQSAPYPRQVAGVALPATPVCVAAHASLSAVAPAFLVNHCLRTYAFGALQMRRERRTFDAQTAFVAAVLHDVGLLAATASREHSFEVDGADFAERFVREQAGTPEQAARVWAAIAMHDLRPDFARHESAEAQLVAAGAAADVVGPDDPLPRADVQSILAAFPRLQFKRRFIALLSDHCERKPRSQRATWLEGFCRMHSAHPAADTTEEAILSAPFTE